MAVAGRGGRRVVAGRLLGFSGLSLLSAVGPFVVLPFIARLVDRPDWAALGIGQSLGAFLGLVVLYGWNLTGPVRVARAGSEERARLYRESLAVRAVVLAVMLPIGVLAAAALAPPGSAALAAVMAGSALLNGLTPAWFCIGAGRPGWIARYDAGPRLAGAVLSVVVVLWTGSVLAYPLTLAAATLLGVWAFTRRHRSAGGERWPSPGDVRGSLRDGRVAATTVALGGVYSLAPVAVAGAVLGVGPLVAFVSAERLYRFGLAAVSTLSNSVQGWVSEAHGSQARRRASAALAAHGVLGVLGLVVLALLGPWASRVLFGDALAAGRAVFVGFGLAFFVISVSTSLVKHVLVPASKTSLALAGTVAGAIVGLPAVLALGSAAGAAGAALAFALAELAVLVVAARGTWALHRAGWGEAVVRAPGAAPGPR
jgi:O-antigen/teichoic acid export membrane protein